VEPEHQTFRFAGTEPVFHQPRPEPSSSPELRDLFKKIIMSIEEEAEPWCEVINRKPCLYRCVNVCDSVRYGEGNLL
jgi:hypothetical protein